MEVTNYIRICRFFTVDIFECRPMKYCLLAISLILTPLILLQGYFFLKKFELKYFVQYEPLYILLLYMVVSIYCQAYTTNIIKSCIHQIQVWKIEEATKEIKGKVTQTWIYITAYMCMTTALGLLGAISFINCIFRKGKILSCGVSNLRCLC
ncbi:uncharacterized protein LOC135129729 [Zophobas morio]|uniref:uncharacterized protein LOC135129729 n=1 Tax=Zophobas morio TaxID=2755281 RepID=UPI0030837EBA